MAMSRIVKWVLSRSKDSCVPHRAMSWVKSKLANAGPLMGSQAALCCAKLCVQARTGSVSRAQFPTAAVSFLDPLARRELDDGFTLRPNS